VLEFIDSLVFCYKPTALLSQSIILTSPKENVVKVIQFKEGPTTFNNRGVELKSIQMVRLTCTKIQLWLYCRDYLYGCG